MKKRKNILSVATICLTALFLVGCSNNSNGNKSANNKPKSKENKHSKNFF